MASGSTRLQDRGSAAGRMKRLDSRIHRRLTSAPSFWSQRRVEQVLRCMCSLPPGSAEPPRAGGATACHKHARTYWRGSDCGALRISEELAAPDPDYLPCLWYALRSSPTFPLQAVTKRAHSACAQHLPLPHSYPRALGFGHTDRTAQVAASSFPSFYLLPKDRAASP